MSETRLNEAKTLAWLSQSRVGRVKGSKLFRRFQPYIGTLYVNGHVRIISEHGREQKYEITERGLAWLRSVDL